VTTTTAAGYPECEVPTAHPIAQFSKRCDGGAEYAGQTSDSEASGQPIVLRRAPAPMPRSCELFNTPSGNPH
jgi:hypothetical protein